MLIGVIEAKEVLTSSMISVSLILIVIGTP